MFLLMLAAMDDSDDKLFMMELYKEYYPLVRKTIYRILLDGRDIDDLVNDVFIKLIEKIPLIRSLDCCKTAAYVVYTSKSVTINYIKHRDVQRKHGFYGGESDMQDEIAGADSVEDFIIRHETMNSLSNAVLKLPERQRDLLYFKYVLGKTDMEIAQDLSISPDSVREYLTRARRAAKKLIESGGSSEC
ncbi:sigma-70 family RNA polymerase sigma factor [Caproiciproducens galactitolivorans]|uniref:RNA polymerase sigma factor SigX n=1 Tax=Caproiciproducens galactitolivorans TaxID=642589 RepID=A0A4Z0YB22_9FIRM|nr:sigma-70 family RNA polymerase sigma factor [Caproiciproducens galactitolivorans]QEY34750.1 sigma-70 family RNA polymerase sigma factor [Caproiciproducens galactitolivorans]TGJ76003.1 RNA polymerase sigma factor SigX [Caproiciproducens galactitolivorans]